MNHISNRDGALLLPEGKHISEDQHGLGSPHSVHIQEHQLWGQGLGGQWGQNNGGTHPAHKEVISDQHKMGRCLRCA